MPRHPGIGAAGGLASGCALLLAERGAAFLAPPGPGTAAASEAPPPAAQAARGFLRCAGQQPLPYGGARHASGLGGALLASGLGLVALRAAAASSRRPAPQQRGRRRAAVVACGAGAGAGGLRKLRIDQVDLHDKRVLIRTDLDVPHRVDPYDITNTDRILRAIPSIKYALENGARSVVLASHIGRPAGLFDEKYSMAPVAKLLEEQLGRPVTLVRGVVGPVVEAACHSPAPGSVILLENVRFYPEEEGGGQPKDANPKQRRKKANRQPADPVRVKAFRASLAKLADVFVSDSFRTAHCGHSSMLGEGYKVRVAGLALARELEAFARVLESPTRPLTGIVGGTRLSPQMGIILNLLEKVDVLIIGGGLALTFLKEQGAEIGASLYDAKGAQYVPGIMQTAKEKGVQIILPVDLVCSTKLAEDGKIQRVSVEEGVPEGFLAVDIGAKSIELNNAAIAKSKSVVWTGTMGAFELASFEAGTRRMLDKVVQVTKAGAVTVLGGSDIASACRKFKMLGKVTHCSAGSDACLELLGGGLLPGVAALDDA